MLEMTNDVIEVQENAKLDDEKRWCVYMHTSPSEKKYVGITSENDPVNRWGLNGNGYLKRKPNGKFHQPAIAAAILKYPNWDDWKHEILLSGLTQQESEEKEIEFIERYDTRNPMYGYNIRTGGNVMAGENNPNYGNHKLAGKNNPMFGVHRYGDAAPMHGKHHTEETKEKISKALTGKFTGENHPMYGKTPSDFCKQRSREANTGYKNWHSRPIYSIELDRLFWGAKEISDEFGFDSSGILKCCKGTKKSCGIHPDTQNRMHWIYVYDYKQTNETIIPGAITLGYITEERVNNYLKELKEKEIDINGTMEKE